MPSGSVSIRARIVSGRMCASDNSGSSRLPRTASSDCARPLTATNVPTWAAVSGRASLNGQVRRYMGFFYTQPMSELRVDFL